MNPMNNLFVIKVIRLFQDHERLSKSPSDEEMLGNIVDLGLIVYI